MGGGGSTVMEPFPECSGAEKTLVERCGEHRQNEEPLTCAVSLRGLTGIPNDSTKRRPER